MKNKERKTRAIFKYIYLPLPTVKFCILKKNYHTSLERVGNYTYLIFGCCCLSALWKRFNLLMDNFMRDWFLLETKQNTKKKIENWIIINIFQDEMLNVFIEKTNINIDANKADE